MLEAEIKRRRQAKDILLMTHIVLGYPSLDECRRVVEQMVEAGVDLMELQIPFSEPIADGPVILHANQRALAGGASVDQCLELAHELSRAFPIPFVFMTYYNIAFVRGPERFAREMRQAGVRGAIIPDLPFEEGAGLLAALGREELDPIFIYAPNTSAARMQAIAQHARGFVYCVARKGVTGTHTDFAGIGAYLARSREHTDLPLALGFGIQSRRDVAAVEGRVDIAVIGSETFRVLEREGLAGVRPFIESLR